MDIQELQEVCRQVRRNIIIMTNKAGAGHPGGSLSATEALVALYFDVMKGIDPKDDKNPNRDRFVLSKGHAAPALYGTLCERGYFGREEFDHFRQLHGILQGHPDVKKCPGRMPCAGWNALTRCRPSSACCSRWACPCAPTRWRRCGWPWRCMAAV